MKMMCAASFLLLAIIGVGCSRTDNPVDTADQQLEKKIIGMWGFPGHSITFHADHTFIQTHITEFPFDSIPDTLTMIGKYQINDGILRYSEINYSEVHLSGDIIGISNEPFEEAVTITENKLSLQPVMTFVSTENNPGQLRGTWKREKWVCSYSIGTNGGYSNAKCEEYFTFGDDTASIHYRIKYILGHGSPNEYSYDIPDFTYHDSKLSIPSLLIRDYSVLLRKNAMLWIASWGPDEYVQNGPQVASSAMQRDIFNRINGEHYYR